MEIDKKTLNLVVPVSTDNGTAYIHSTPIRREVFREHFLVLSKTLNSMYAEGVSQVTGPRIAALMLEKISKEDGIWETDGAIIGVKDSLINEIRRLSNVILSTSEGWKTIPLMDAVNQGKLEIEDVEEAEGFIVFFTCISRIHKRKEVLTFLGPMAKLWNTQSTLLNVTEYIASLPTLKTEETLAPEVPTLSIPV